MQVALRLLAEGGCHALTIRNIACELGITEPAIYRHFGSKKELLMALYGYVWLRLKEEVLPLAEGEENAAERLRRLMKGTFSFLSKNRGVNLVLLSEAIHHNDPDLKEAMFRLVSGFQHRLKEILLQGVREGLFRTDLDPDVASRGVMGFIQSTLILSLLRGGEWEMENGINQFLSIFFKGIER